MNTGGFAKALTRTGAVLGTPYFMPPEQGFGPPAENMAAEHIWHVVGILEDKYGWSDDEIRGFLGGNLLRLYEANWQ